MNETGIKWIGCIPDDWHTARMKDICSFISRGVAPTYNDEGVSYAMNQATFSKGFIDYSNLRTSTKEDARALICNGDLLMASTGGGVLGKVAYAEKLKETFYADSHVTIIRGKSGITHSKYLYYFFSINYSTINEVLAKGSTNQTELQRDQLNEFQVPVPSYNEQLKIASYLDEKCSKIDAVVATLRKLADKYASLKRSLINETVCRGLNKNVTLKPSGIDWIGDIPEHWSILRLKDVCAFRNGYTPSKANSVFWEGGEIPWYRMEDIRKNGRKLKDSILHITKSAVKGEGVFEANSFILATTATIGEHAQIIVDSLANQQFTNLKIRKSLGYGALSSDFFFYYLFIIDDFCKYASRMTTFPAVCMEDLKTFMVAIPPFPEQQTIANYLDEKCAKIDAIVNNIKTQIEEYTKLKKSLINEVVTGKRRVI